MSWQLTKKQHLKIRSISPGKCKYCNKQVSKSNSSLVCTNCKNKEREGFFIIKKMREENGIKP